MPKKTERGTLWSPPLLYLLVKLVWFSSLGQRVQFGNFLKFRRTFGVPWSTLHGYLSKILARSCQDLGKFLAKIVTRYCQELQDAMVRSYQESHVSKKNFTKKPNMAIKI